MLSRRELIQGAVSIPLAAGEARALRFATLSDIQYADRDTAGKRDYRGSLAKLEAAASAIDAEKPAFTIQLGDLINDGAANYDRISAAYQRIHGPKYNVLGNHDFFGPRAEVLRRFGLKRAYYSFRLPGWRFIALDGMAISITGGWPAGSPQRQLGEQMLSKLKQQHAINAQEWNGAIGDEQRLWLRRELDSTGRRNERSIVFCHLPTLPEACRPEHLLWDYRQVLEILDSQPSVAAYICGHDHAGGYAEHNGVHHITLAGLVENELATCLRFVDLHRDDLVLRKPDGTADKKLALRKRRL